MSYEVPGLPTQKPTLEHTGILVLWLGLKWKPRPPGTVPNERQRPWRKPAFDLPGEWPEDFETEMWNVSLG